MATILVVDDETPILDAIAYNLRKEGFTPILATDAGEAITAFEQHKPALVVLDVMLPSASGFEVCRLLRRRSDVPIIMLTARADETDRVVGLEIGADDYVTKPFSMRELLARIRSVLRRTTAEEPPAESAKLRIGDVEIDEARHTVQVRGAPVELSPREHSLLLYLARRPNQALARDMILDRVWGADAYVGGRTVDVHIRWLREKLEVDPSQPQLIVTVRGLGYKLVTPG